MAKKKKKTQKQIQPLPSSQHPAAVQDVPAPLPEPAAETPSSQKCSPATCLALLGGKPGLLSAAAAWAFWAGCLLLWELVLRFWSGQTGSLGPAAAVAIPVGGVLAMLLALPGRAGRICGWVLPWLALLFYATQLVYHDIFGSFLSLSLLVMGGDAITAFWNIVLEGLSHALPALLLLIAPLALFCVGWKKGRRPVHQGWARAAVLAVCAAVTAGLWLSLPAPGIAESVDQWIGRHGLLSAEVMDLRQMLHPPQVDLLPAGEDLPIPDERLSWSDSTLYNVLPGLDFERLEQRADTEQLRSLTQYFSQAAPTSKNQYTGLFKGKNLIIICAESFSPYLVDPELTPTLYRLSHQGFQFSNFYNSYPSVTINGEYGMAMGLLPDFSCMSFSTSANNYWPFCLGTAWKQTGATPVAYHNGDATFYNRINSHPNMGYEFKARGFHLDVANTNPGSDLEMMEKTIDEYIGREPFCAYYMSYSGHGPYNFSTNAMAIKNQALVADLDLPDALRAYYATQLEFEQSLTYLMDRLEQAGKLENTVIVISGDHQPYNLSAEDYKRLAGAAVQNKFWDYLNAFYCWSADMEQPVNVEHYCCTQDILPTVLNLFGLDYDSRLLAGRDVLAEGTHVAELKDGSFLTDRLIYDAATGEMMWNGEADAAYAAAFRRRVSNDFAMSAAILKSDYFGFASDMLGAGEQEPVHQFYSPFTDIEGRWYESSVNELSIRGVLSGQERFSGDQASTRAEFIVMMTRSLRILNQHGEHPFSDLGENNWYVDAVAAMWDMGLLPDEGPLFRPFDSITLQQAQDILLRTYNHLNLDNAEQLTRLDIQEVATLQGEEAFVEPGVLSRGGAAYVVAQMALRANLVAE